MNDSEFEYKKKCNKHNIYFLVTTQNISRNNHDTSICSIFFLLSFQKCKKLDQVYVTINITKYVFLSCKKKIYIFKGAIKE